MTTHHDYPELETMKNTTTTKSARLSMHEVARAYTYDPADCTASGYLVQLYTDGHVAITSCSRWEGSRDGERWITEAGYVDPQETYGVTAEYVELVREENLRDLGVGFEDDLYHGDGRVPAGFRQVCKGWIVR